MNTIQEIKPNSWVDYVGAVFLMIVFLVGIVFVWRATHKETPVSLPRPVVECPKDTDSYQAIKNNKNVVLMQNVPSRGIAGNGFDPLYRISLKRTGTSSEIACGYLAYRISVGNKPIDMKYDNLYMLPTDSQFGRHIVPTDKDIVGGAKNTDTYTEIVIPLDSIPFSKDRGRDNPDQVNWVAMLNVSDHIDFDVAFNTLNKLGRIESLEIAYKCWNPKTGEETKDCRIDQVKTEIIK